MHLSPFYRTYFCPVIDISLRTRTIETCKLTSDSVHIIMETIPTVFHSITYIKNILNQKEYNNLEPVNKLITTYNEKFAIYGNLKENNQKKHPFIVFEGLDATGKSTISRRIAEKYKGFLLSTPPKCICNVRTFFDDHMLRSPYYSLGNYIGELEVLGCLQKGPVFLDRYWYSTAVYALAQSVQDGESDALPPKSDKVYTWPSDLLKPDLVIMLVTSEEERLRRIARRRNITNQERQLKASSDFRANIMQAYRNMDGPKIEFIDGNASIEKTVALVDGNIRHLF